MARNVSNDRQSRLYHGAACPSAARPFSVGGNGTNSVLQGVSTDEVDFFPEPLTAGATAQRVNGSAGKYRSNWITSASFKKAWASGFSAHSGCFMTSRNRLRVARAFPDWPRRCSAKARKARVAGLERSALAAFMRSTCASVAAAAWYCSRRYWAMPSVVRRLLSNGMRRLAASASRSARR